MERGLAVSLAALYLRGGGRSARTPSSRWPAVLRGLRLDPGDPAGALRRAGWAEEAAVLEDGHRVGWAEAVVGRGECLTAADAAYPLGWLAVLGARAPAAVWLSGPAPPQAGLAVVGSRRVEASVGRFAFGVGEAAAGLGLAVVSGGAPGCDRAAQSGAARAGGWVIEVCPCGLGVGGGLPLWPGGPAATRLSACGPDEPFSAGTAMERNALVYAMAPHAVVVHARLREGGTWHGASEALRRRLTRLVVRDDPGDVALRALAALGAARLAAPGDLAEALSAPAVQPGLFLLG